MDVDAFIQWSTKGRGGAEQSNYASFLCALCDVIGVPLPDHAQSSSETNDYVFERGLKARDPHEPLATRRIDLYKRDCFVLEAKQSRSPGTPKAGDSVTLERGRPPLPPGRRDVARGWDVLMTKARIQAEDYVSRLPVDHAAPPFIIICDIGHVFEFYADFTGSGRNYTHFPDREGFRVYVRDLADGEVRARLRTIWTDPWSLDPAKQRIPVTREIAERLAQVAQALEQAVDPRPKPEDVALFLARCIFTMFASSVGLLPVEGFSTLLENCIESPDSFKPLVTDLWRKFNDPKHERRFFSGFLDHVPFFGGRLFHHVDAYGLDAQGVGHLLVAARCDWSKVEPAIFGALLERALSPIERRRLGAHYTPRAYVERMVSAVVMEPLRSDWTYTLRKIASSCERDEIAKARQHAREFLHKLCRIKVLDPACGTGNFLYVALDLVKRLEVEVFETLAKLGAEETLGLDGVDPSNFLGLEINPRAVVIAELVMQIGWLQLHYRGRSGHPAEPILKTYKMIALADAILDWDGAPLPAIEVVDGRRVESYPHPKRPEWPAADFIIGNPPFLGGKDFRARLDTNKAEAIWAAHPSMAPATDLVMYWWDHAAELLTRPHARLRRFGFVTTNSITQSFQRRVVQRWLDAADPIRLRLAIPDHPWTRATPHAAAVRIAMTVAERASARDGPDADIGVRLILIDERGADGDCPDLAFRREIGRINADLTIGSDLTRATPLLANRGLCSPGVKLHGAGFIVSLDRARELGLGRRAGLEAFIRPYVNGRDVVQRSRDAWVIDLYPLAEMEVRRRFPEVYQHLLTTVKPERDRNRMAFRRENWWWFGATHETYRTFVKDLTRYIATPETAKHRVFVFLDAGVRADNMLVNIGIEDAFGLGVLSSRVHGVWALATGAVLEDRPRYTKSLCFDPFPFPRPDERLRAEIAMLAEELDATRRVVCLENPDLTLTRIYNAIGTSNGADCAPRDVLERGRIGILADIHRRIDERVMQAYGWSNGMSDGELLDRLAALNAQRRDEERRGQVAWLRPSFQKPRFAKRSSAPADAAAPAFAFPAAKRALRVMPPCQDDHPREVEAVIRIADRALTIEEIVSAFHRGKNVRMKVTAALATLTRYGWVSALPGGRFLARLVA